jgi:hypothetical protein
MKVLFVWVTAVVSCAIVTIFWLVGNSVVLAIVDGALSGVSGQASSLVTIIEYIAVWWGPIFDVVLILWAIINSEPEEVYSVLR